jgi:hypothetical protein
MQARSQLLVCMAGPMSARGGVDSPNGEASPQLTPVRVRATHPPSSVAVVAVVSTSGQPALYEIEVFTDEGSMWTIRRRYSEFGAPPQVAVVPRPTLQMYSTKMHRCTCYAMRQM